MSSGWIWFFVVLIIFAAWGKNKDDEEKKRKAEEQEKKRKEAEEYILNSGDTEAIKALMLARANPSGYGQVMMNGVNSGNSTLKTAMGVMTGVVAGNMIANALTASAIQGSLDSLQTDLINKADLTDAQTESMDKSASNYDSYSDESGGGDYDV